MSFFGMPGVGVASRQGGAGMQVPMSIPQDVVRVGEQAMWSTQRYLAGTSLANINSKVFSVNLGTAGQGFALPLSIAETNQQIGGQTPSSQAFDVYGIACQPYTLPGDTADTLFPLVGADARNVQANLVLRWIFTQTFIDIATASLIGQGGGLFGATADTGAAEGGSGGSRTLINNGNGQLWVYQEHPVALPATTQFGIGLLFGQNAIPVDGGADDYALAIRIALLGKFKAAIVVA